MEGSFRRLQLEHVDLRRMAVILNLETVVRREHLARAARTSSFTR